MEQEKNIRASFSQMSQSCILQLTYLKRDTILHPTVLPIFSDTSHLDKDNQATRRFTGRENTPDDRMQLTECQIEHGQFIYSLPPEERNDYRQIFQFRMLNARQQYINVSSRQQVIETDRNGKAWIIME